MRRVRGVSGGFYSHQVDETSVRCLQTGLPARVPTATAPGACAVSAGDVVCVCGDMCVYGDMCVCGDVCVFSDVCVCGGVWCPRLPYYYYWCGHVMTVLGWYIYC